jgi:hypothetical protein
MSENIRKSVLKVKPLVIELLEPTWDRLDHYSKLYGIPKRQIISDALLGWFTHQDSKQDKVGDS